MRAYGVTEVDAVGRSSKVETAFSDATDEPEDEACDLREGDIEIEVLPFFGRVIVRRLGDYVRRIYFSSFVDTVVSHHFVGHRRRLPGCRS